MKDVEETGGESRRVDMNGNEYPQESRDANNKYYLGSLGAWEGIAVTILAIIFALLTQSIWAGVCALTGLSFLWTISRLCHFQSARVWRLSETRAHSEPIHISLDDSIHIEQRVIRRNRAKLLLFSAWPAALGTTLLGQRDNVVEHWEWIAMIAMIGVAGVGMLILRWLSGDPVDLGWRDAQGDQEHRDEVKRAPIPLNLPWILLVILGGLWWMIHQSQGTLSVMRPETEGLHWMLFVASNALLYLSLGLSPSPDRFLSMEGHQREERRGSPALILWRSRFSYITPVVFGIALLYIENTMFVGQYEPLHLALFINGVLFLEIGALSVLSTRLLYREMSASTQKFDSLSSGALLSLTITMGALFYLSASMLVQSPSERSTVIEYSHGELLLNVAGLFFDFEEDIEPQERLEHPALSRPKWHEITPPSTIKKPHLILISIDTLRPGMIDLKDPTQAGMPKLSRWAQEGVASLNAYAIGSRTAIGMSGILLGRYSRNIDWELWAYRRGKIYPPSHGKPLKKHIYTTIPKMERGDRLAERLQDAGYYTVAVPYAGHNAFFRRGVGFEVGFDHYLDLSKKKWKRKSARNVWKTAKRAIKHAQEHRGDRPLFLWVHFYDPHESRKSKRRYRSLSKFTDRYVHILLSHLDKIGIGDDALTVVVSDHGEAFKEHRLSGHASSLYEAQIKIPIIWGFPKNVAIEPQALQEPLSQVDIPSTLLATAGASMSALDGVNLWPIFTREASLEGRPVFSELHRYQSSKGKKTKNLNAVIHRGFKLIEDHKRGTTKLFNLKSDPRERRNLCTTTEREQCDTLKTLLRAFRSQGIPPP